MLEKARARLSREGDVYDEHLRYIEAKWKECFDFVSRVEGNALTLDAIVKELRDTTRPKHRTARMELELAINYLNMAVLMLNDAASLEVSDLIEEANR